MGINHYHTDQEVQDSNGTDLKTCFVGLAILLRSFMGLRKEDSSTIFGLISIDANEHV